MDSLKNIRVFNLQNLFDPKIDAYIDATAEFNSVESFRFHDPGQGSVLMEEIQQRLASLDHDIGDLEYLEKTGGNDLVFSVIPVPLMSTAGISRKLNGVDFGRLGSNGVALLKDDFPRIYSNWQASECGVEDYLNAEIEPGWYLFLRSTLSDFCGLSFNEQCVKLPSHTIYRALQDAHLIGDPGEELIAKVEYAYPVGCLESLMARRMTELPIKKGFLRTRTLYSDGSRLGILGSSFGFDLDGFWTGEGKGVNISLAICFKIQDL